ncbi:DUF2339 domain-containing protein [Paenibacillus alkalitolerans]|uniref:DUF2339 domain-containing protein n=1 Tax=Paenibacillus alkalitolerans TaxID=2799335 RepID=UPI0018F4CDCB|nr:DUF2339 domain-containing protein [Paenibacillus alkalitolerans]
MTDQKIRKHWTSLLGITFILFAFVTLFQYTSEQGWLTDEIKIGIGLLLGSGLVVGGYALLQKTAFAALSEMVSGLGFAVLYTTFSFAGIYFDLWNPMTVFLCMVGVTAVLGLYSYRFHSRLLMNVGLAGALISPVVMRPETDQVFTLFLYLFVINAVFFALSIYKRWPELRSVAFAGTWLMFAVYYFHFSPDLDEIWHVPFRYAAAAFLFYVIAFFVSSWRNNLKFEGSNLYLGIANAVLFGLWSVTILEHFAAPSVPLLGMGVIYLTLGWAVYRLSGRAATAPVLTKLLGGALLLLIAAAQFGGSLEAKPLIDVIFWELVAVLLVAAGQWKRIDILKGLSVFVWLCAGSYWFFTTWEAPIGEWFGTFIPFLNWGAVAWIILAGIGFYYSMRVRFSNTNERDNRVLAVCWSILSHMVVGGLLTVQTINLFEAYDSLNHAVSLNLTLSIAWGIYSVLLFLWGAYSRQNAFRIFGSAVLAVVAVKALFFDMIDEDSLYRIVVLLVLGLLCFAVTWINMKWKPAPKD